MKILVKSRKYIEKQMENNSNWHFDKWIISIYSEGSYSPIHDRFNVLKLNFDDISERDIDTDIHNEIFFNEKHAKEIHEFITSINDDCKKLFYIHCDAGISRSGAVGYILNEYFNKYLIDNKEDYKFFEMNNSQIMPNPLVVRLLKKELFGISFFGIEVNDYEYNEDGEKINHIERI